MLGFKDGASWAALEYAKNIRETGKALSTGGEVTGEPKDVTIVIAGITYTDKTKYRSSAVMQCVPPGPSPFSTQKVRFADEASADSDLRSADRKSVV